MLTDVDCPLDGQPVITHWPIPPLNIADTPV